MPIYFTFTSTDAHVTSPGYGLSATEIGNVATWQDTSQDYHFSFHETHEAGHPIYVCDSSQHGGRNMPKVDLKDKAAKDLAMVNSGKLSKSQRQNALAVITANLVAFQKMARLYYTGAQTTALAAAAEPESVKCKKCGKEIGFVTANSQGKRVCPSCKSWN